MDVGVGVGVVGGEGVVVGVNVGAGLGLEVRVGVGDRVGVGVAVGPRAAVGVRTGVGVGVGAVVSMGVGLSDAVGAGVKVVGVLSFPVQDAISSARVAAISSDNSALFLRIWLAKSGIFASIPMRQYASAGQLFRVEYMNYEGIANVLLIPCLPQGIVVYKDMADGRIRSEGNGWVGLGG